MVLIVYSALISSRQEVVIPTKLENQYIPLFVKDVDRYMRQVVERTGTPGAAIAVVKGDQVLFTRGYGVKVFNTFDSVNANTVFRLGSVSKSVSATLAGSLVDQGFIDWDDPVIRHLPGFKLKNPQQSSHITIRHVLSHTTGLPYHSYTNLIEEGLPLKEIIKKLADINLISREGKRYSYQNVAYSVLGEVIEGASGDNFNHWMQKGLFEPLKMKNSSVDYESIVDHPNVAKPHRRGGRQWYVTKITRKYYNAVPAGGVNSSANDMAQWMLALLGNYPEVVSQSALDSIFKPYVKTSIRRSYLRKWRDLKEEYYGMGWRILPYPGDTVQYHGGYVNFYRSEVGINRKEKIGFCVLANAPTQLTSKCIPDLLHIYDQYADRINARNREISLAYERMEREKEQLSASR